MSENKDLGQSEPRGVSRRTVTKAMAWSVPVIAVASASPAFAASCIPTLSLSPRSCKCPGQSTCDPFGYNLYICAGGTTCPNSSITLTVKRVVKRNSGDILWQGSQTLNAGECYLFHGNSSDSGTWIDVYYTIEGQDGEEMFSTQSPPDCDKVENPIATCDNCA